MATDTDAKALFEPLQLPCGVELKNRLIKSAMSDSLGNGQGNPTDAQIRLYERWAEGGASLSLIGEVQIDPRYPEKPGNLVLAPDADLRALRELATRGAVNGGAIWPQLGHAGALAHGPISEPKGPSPLNVPGLSCDGLSFDEVAVLPEAYAKAASIAKELGFGGVQVHAGHGFLLSQFLSPLFNHRTDMYGGTISARFQIVQDVIEAVRGAVGSAFPIGIKINSTDQLEGGLTSDEALEIVRMLDKSSVDLIEISGGTYFPGAASSSDGSPTKGPYFEGFGRLAKQATTIPVVVTGGFRTRAQAEAALNRDAADAIGLARAMVLDPNLPCSWSAGPAEDPEFPRFDAPPPGAVTAWYTMRMTALGQEDELGFELSAQAALDAYDARDLERCRLWRSRFPG